MGKEGPEHARFSDLMTTIFGFWAFLHPDVEIECEIVETSRVLEGLPIALLEQTLERLSTQTNTAAANWLMQQLQASGSRPEN